MKKSFLRKQSKRFPRLVMISFCLAFALLLIELCDGEQQQQGDDGGDMSVARCVKLEPAVHINWRFCQQGSATAQGRDLGFLYTFVMKGGNPGYSDESLTSEINRRDEEAELNWNYKNLNPSGAKITWTDKSQRCKEAYLALSCAAMFPVCKSREPCIGTACSVPSNSSFELNYRQVIRDRLEEHCQGEGSGSEESSIDSWLWSRRWPDDPDDVSSFDFTIPEGALMPDNTGEVTYRLIHLGEFLIHSSFTPELGYVPVQMLVAGVALCLCACCCVCGCRCLADVRCCKRAVRTRTFQERPVGGGRRRARLRLPNALRRAARQRAGQRSGAAFSSLSASDSSGGSSPSSVKKHRATSTAFDPDLVGKFD